MIRRQALDMFPGVPAKDMSDRSLAHPELGREFTVSPLARGVQRPDLGNIAPGELGFAVLFSLEHASFGDGIMHVVGIGSEEQVGGVYARGLVAAMADMESAGVDSVGEEVGHSVCIKIAFRTPIQNSVPDRS